MNLKNKSILVTGGAGFIGSHLVDRIIKERPEKLVIVDNFFLGNHLNIRYAEQNFEGLKVYHQDASDYEKMKGIIEIEHTDVVFNLAVIPLLRSHTNPRLTFEENINITLTMCELIRNERFKTLIHCSSSEAYGSAQYLPMDEDHPLRPTTPYGASKTACDQLVISYYETFGIDASIVRPFNNYGPRQNEGSYAGVVPLTIKRILNSKAPVIYGDGEQTRDYMYATDTANAIVDIYNCSATRGKVLNIATGKEITIKELITTISYQLNCDKTILYEMTRNADVRRHRGDISLAKKLIDFKPKVSLEEGIRLTVEWYKKNLNPNTLEHKWVNHRKNHQKPRRALL